MGLHWSMSNIMGANISLVLFPPVVAPCPIQWDPSNGFKIPLSYLFIPLFSLRLNYISLTYAHIP